MAPISCLLNGVPWTQGDTATIDELSSADKNCVLDWILRNVHYTEGCETISSYSLKHHMERDIGIYTTNNQFKHAMLISGFQPVSYNELNWEYNVTSDKSPYAVLKEAEGAREKIRRSKYDACQRSAHLALERGDSMPNNEYPTKESVMQRAQELVDARLPFGALDVSGRLSERNKGDLGQIIEEGWYGYSPNSDAEPDFAEAGVELKVSPYKFTRNGVSAKERLVCDIINYMEEVEKTFETSAFWHKCKCICLLSYQWLEGAAKADMFVDHATLLNEYPIEDLLIIKHDWEVIIRKIRAGEAHLLTEGDTMYLAACTKGATAETSYRQQPFSHLPAKQRAYSLKTTYMTRLLRKYVFGEDEDEHIIKDWHQLETASFDDIVLRMFRPFQGLSTREIALRLGMTWEDDISKSINASVTRRILGIIGDPDRAEEFKNANITVKTIVVNQNNQPEQCMSFPSFSFMDILEQEWEDTDVYNQMAASRFLFVVFERENKAQIPVLRKAFFWNMPADDIEELRQVWVKTRIAIGHGAGLQHVGATVRNTLPKATESYLAHVRPHASRAAYRLADGTVIGNPERDANPLPDGQWMTTQCFWFNRSYTQHIIEQAEE